VADGAVNGRSISSEVRGVHPGTGGGGADGGPGDGAPPGDFDYARPRPLPNSRRTRPGGPETVGQAERIPDDPGRPDGGPGGDQERAWAARRSFPPRSTRGSTAGRSARSIRRTLLQQPRRHPQPTPPQRRRRSTGSSHRRSSSEPRPEKRNPRRPPPSPPDERPIPSIRRSGSVEAQAVDCQTGGVTMTAAPSRSPEASFSSRSDGRPNAGPPGYPKTAKKPERRPPGDQRRSKRAP
jgi:hypothetical protein